MVGKGGGKMKAEQQGCHGFQSVVERLGLRFVGLKGK
jgi:hypothetical protein